MSSLSSIRKNYISHLTLLIPALFILSGFRCSSTTKLQKKDSCHRLQGTVTRIYSSSNEDFLNPE